MGHDIMTARCLCGAVELELTPPTSFCDHCHCESCRRAHAAPLVTWVGLPRAQLQISGENALRRYSSSPGAWRHFCGTCGTPMVMTYDPAHASYGGSSHLAFVPLGALDSPLDRSPSGHLSSEEAVAWFPFSDDLPRYVAKSEAPA